MELAPTIGSAVFSCRFSSPLAPTHQPTNQPTLNLSKATENQTHQPTNLPTTHNPARLKGQHAQVSRKETRHQLHQRLAQAAPNLGLCASPGRWARKATRDLLRRVAILRSGVGGLSHGFPKNGLRDLQRKSWLVKQRQTMNPYSSFLDFAECALFLG